MSSASTIKKNFISLSVFLFILLEGEYVGDVAYLGRGVGRGEAGLEGGLSPSATKSSSSKSSRTLKKSFI